MTAALQHQSTAFLGITHYFAGEGITPLVVYGRPVSIAEPATIDVVAQVRPVEVSPSRRLGKWRSDALKEQYPGNHRAIRFLAPILTQPPPEREPLEVIPRRLVVPMIEPLPAVGIDVAIPIGIR